MQLHTQQPLLSRPVILRLNRRSACAAVRCAVLAALSLEDLFPDDFTVSKVDLRNSI
jgi:hypothetical protein